MLAKSVRFHKSIRLPLPLPCRWSSSKSKFTPIADLLSKSPKPAGGFVSVAGYVRSVRKQKHVAFVALQDGSSINTVQAVLSPEQAETLTSGSAVVVYGRWLESRGGGEQPYELQADEVSVQGRNDASTNPIQKKYQSAEFLRTLPHLRLRTPQAALMLRLRSQVIASATAFFNERSFVQAHTPIITSSDCEGAGEVFRVETNSIGQDLSAGGTNIKTDNDSFFGSPKFLTVSAQLHLEALSQSLGNVWTLSPAFRAEKSDTARHLSEFYMLEAEMAFTEDLNEVMDLVEDLIRSITTLLRSSRTGDEFLSSADTAPEDKQDEHDRRCDSNALTLRWDSIMGRVWPRITFQDACKAIKHAQESGRFLFEKLPHDTTGLQTEHERYLTDILYAGPVFVTDYPSSLKPFYMAPSAQFHSPSRQQPPTVACFDLLLPGVCEVVGGSMREHRLEVLEEQMQSKGLLQATALARQARKQPHTVEGCGANLDWYLDLRRYGSVPHGGFGLGFDRLLACLSGVTNVRDVVTFPRYYKRCLA